MFGLFGGVCYSRVGRLDPKAASRDRRLRFRVLSFVHEGAAAATQCLAEANAGTD
jgi:hypothetical protein